MFLDVQNISFFTMFIEEHIHKMSTNQISLFPEKFVRVDQYVRNIKKIKEKVTKNLVNSHNKFYYKN